MCRHVLAATLMALTAGCLDRLPITPRNDPRMGLEPRLERRVDAARETLTSPVRIATTPMEDLLVSDSRRAMIYRLDAATLQPLSAMTVAGTPLAVGLLGGRIFVGNAATRQVEVYGSRGRYEYSFAVPVEYPSDLAVDAELGLVFVVDAVAKEVKVFSQRGQLQRVIPAPGAAVGAALHVPTGIALDPVRHEVLVSDYPDPAAGGNAAVRIYSYEGALLQVLSPGRCGSMGCTGGFSRPQGLALDAQGRIYLADALLAQVLVFDRQTLTLVGTLGGRPELRVPLDVAIGRDGDLFVTSNRTASVAVFPKGVLP